MSTVSSDGRRKGLLALAALENKKNIDFSAIENALSSLASCGYYFDRISRVAYNDPDEIVSALSDGLDNYENIVILCPVSMAKTVSDFVCGRVGAEFDGLGILRGAKKHVFLLFSDGENRLQFSDIKSVLDTKYGLSYGSTVVRAVGVPKKLLDETLSSVRGLFVGGTANFKVTDDYDDVRIEIIYSSKTPKMAVDGAVREIVKRLNDFVYALEDVTLAEQLYRLLKLRRMKISVAESFTGGGVSKRLVEVSGVSEVYFEGLNTYSNEAKMQRLGVAELTLNQRGAVSAETAYQMAVGLIKTGNCEVAISTTGIAGPKSDNTSKPVGLAYIGIGVEDDIAVYKFNFAGDRKTVTETAINHALFLAYKRLK